MRRMLIGSVCAAIAIVGLVAGSLSSLAQKPPPPSDKSGSGQIHRSLGF